MVIIHMQWNKNQLDFVLPFRIHHVLPPFSYVIIFVIRVIISVDDLGVKAWIEEGVETEDTRGEMSKQVRDRGREGRTFDL
jgi:hypothetical protein